MHHLLTRNSSLEEQLLTEYGMNLETVRNRFGLSTEKFVKEAREKFESIKQLVKSIIALCDEKIPQAEVSFFRNNKNTKRRGLCT